jgi:predicted kinase
MFLIQMAGFPGSGKSTLSKLIGSKIGAIVIDKDVIKSSLRKADMTDEDAGRISYQITFDLAEHYLSTGNSVVIDTPCYFQEIIKNGQSIALKYDAHYKFIECQVTDFELITDRITKRDNMISQIRVPTIEGFERAKYRAQRPKNSKYIIVDTTNYDSINIKEIEKYLKEYNQYSEEKVCCSTDL